MTKDRSIDESPKIGVWMLWLTVAVQFKVNNLLATSSNNLRHWKISLQLILRIYWTVTEPKLRTKKEE